MLLSIIRPEEQNFMDLIFRISRMHKNQAVYLTDILKYAMIIAKNQKEGYANHVIPDFTEIFF